MSQHDFEIANQGFPATRADLNNALQALASLSAGTSEPTTTYPYQLWYDETNELLKMRNSDDDAFITLAAFDQTNDEWEVRSAVIQAVDSAGVVIKTDDGTTRLTVADSGAVSINTSLDVDNININGNTISSTDTNGNITLAPNGTGVVALSSTDLTFGDQDKAIFGAGSDLQIFHDGSHSFIQDKGTGDLFVDGDNDLTFRSGDGLATKAKFTTLGACELYHNNSQKLATTSTGIDVTGTIEFGDGHTIGDDASDNLEIASSSGEGIFISPEGTNTARFDTSGNFFFNSGFGSVATAYGCRAWVNFNGTGTVAIREDGNVSSITDNGTGSYTVNFATAMPDSNYAVSGSSVGISNVSVESLTTSSFTVITTGDPGFTSVVDRSYIGIMVAR